MRATTPQLLAIWLLLLGVAPVAAQVRIGDGNDSPLRSLGDGLAAPLDDSNPVRVEAQFTTADDRRPAVLMVTAEMAPDWHVYALTQPPGGPTKTKIELAPSPDYRVIGQFRSYPPPESRIDDEAWVGLELQEHHDEVTWYAPIELADGVDPETLEIRGQVRMLACKQSCIPANRDFVARRGSGVPIGPLEVDRSMDDSPPDAGDTLSISATHQATDSEVVLALRLAPARLEPGDTAELTITATPADHWHVYAYAERDDQPGSKPTLIAFDPPSGLTLGRPTTQAPIETDDSVPSFGTMRYHPGAVTWTVDVHVAEDAAAGEHPITGVIGYQACESSADGLGTCELPKAVRFDVPLIVGDEPAAAGEIRFSAAKYPDAKRAADAWADQRDQSHAVAAAAEPQQPAGAAERVAPPAGDGQATPYDLDRVELEKSDSSLARFVALAFLGGIILNLMPCVLPVIGLKVMSFVEQAGKSRAHALALNIWYSAGIVAVFILLGLLAVWAGLSWGGQFGSTAFNATLAAIVFAMALSLLGVWEIPIPGFFGSGAAQEAAAREGPLGAFLKGVVTTVLATPCTGPFMATAIAWAVRQPASTTLTVFTSLGMGMASPFLVVGVFPELLRFLPKPGPWMETFKAWMGFILLATVVYIMAFIATSAVVPTLLLLLGIGIACWLVARTPLTAALRDRLQSWALAGAIVLLFAVAAFGWLYPNLAGATRAAPLATATGVSDTEAPWQPFSLDRLGRVAVEDGRTVLVDFSAEWCLTCKFLEKTVLHTADVERAIGNSGAVTMYADFTDYAPEIERTIKALQANGVPVIAIFPGDRPYEPIVFRGGYTKADLLSALQASEHGKPSIVRVAPEEQRTAAGWGRR